MIINRPPLVGAEKYRREPETENLTRVSKLVEQANEVSIFDVLKDMLRVEVPQGGESYKAYCPFMVEHGDGGWDKGWRVYPATNSSYCFIMHGVMPPVRLVQIRFDLRQNAAAEKILKQYDLLKPKPFRERFELEQQRRDTARERSVGTPQQAVEALQMALSRVEGYDSRQFDRDVQDAMERVLSILEKVFEAPNTEDLLRGWLTRAKTHMTQVVEGAPTS